MSTLTAEIVELEKQLEAANERVRMFAGIDVNANRQALTDVDSITAELERKREEFGRQQEIEQKIEGEGITFQVPGVDFTKLPADLIKLIDGVVRADRRRIYAEESVRYDALVESTKERLEAADAREKEFKQQNDTLYETNRKLTAENAELNSENARLTEENGMLKGENDDLHARLKNATNQIEEADQEIKRLNSHVDELRAAQVFGERKAQNVIDVTPNEAEDLQDVVNRIVGIQHINGNWHEVVKEDGSKIVVHQSELPELQKQVQQQVPSFRGEDTPSLPGGDQFHTPEATALVVPQFPVPTGAGLHVEAGGAAEDSPGVGASKTLEERVAELERHCFGRVNGEVA
ncbi:hypothetical protein WMW72_10700 [Paenibacillus filicis]|uniref:Chromosome partition protein Smc n=1 Tax=Paenibacillus filicis TaxID=669464 RepID=A0ABU9DHN7_9BACL